MRRQLRAIRRGGRSAPCAIICALMVTSCASLNINAIPLPGSNNQDGYDIVAEFANVLNLPDRAKVVMDGTTVGVVEKVRVASDHVDVTARIQKGVEVPSDSKAALQQATVLGDIYVALDRGQDVASAAPPLSPGGRIPLAQTTSPPQLEDTIANLANFIGSGSIQRAQNTLININRVTPPKDEERRVVSQVTTDLKGLSDNVDNVDLLLHGLSQTRRRARLQARHGLRQHHGPLVAVAWLYLQRRILVGSGVAFVGGRPRSDTGLKPGHRCRVPGLSGLHQQLLPSAGQVSRHQHHLNCRA
jgi:ABC-type transporter Mla subunit MlaD